jgi:hypothetical protein
MFTLVVKDSIQDFMKGAGKRNAHLQIRLTLFLLGLHRAAGWQVHLKYVPRCLPLVEQQVKPGGNPPLDMTDLLNRRCQLDDRSRVLGRWI